MKSKLDEFYEIHSGGAIRYFENQSPLLNPPQTATTTRQKLVFYMKRYFREVYPYINAGWYLAILTWHLRYLFGNNDYHNPLFQFMGIKLLRLAPHDIVFFPHLEVRSNRVVTADAKECSDSVAEVITRHNSR
jgi:peroxin-12